MLRLISFDVASDGACVCVFGFGGPEAQPSVKKMNAMKIIAATTIPTPVHSVPVESLRATNLCLLRHKMGYAYEDHANPYELDVRPDKSE